MSRITRPSKFSRTRRLPVRPLCLSLSVVLAAAQAQEPELPTVEAGLLEVESGDGEWRTAGFSKPFDVVPVVVSGPVSAHTDTTPVLEIRELSAEGFEYRVQGTEAPETFSYLAMEPGAYEYGGLRWEAARLSAEDFERGIHLFRQKFRNRPVVLAQAGGGRELRVSETTRKAFAFDLSGEGNPSVPAGFIAVETGLGRDADWLMVSGRETDLEGGQWHDIRLPLELRELLFVARFQDSPGVSGLKHRFLVRDGVTVGFQTLPMVDGTGDVCYLVLGNVGEAELEEQESAALTIGPDVVNPVFSHKDRQPAGDDKKAKKKASRRQVPDKAGSGPQSGIVFQYLFEGSGATVTDSEGGHNGTLHGQTTRVASGDPDRGQVIDYPSSNDWVTVPASAFDGLSDLSLTMWFKSNSTADLQFWSIVIDGNTTSAWHEFGFRSWLTGGNIAVFNHHRFTYYPVNHALWFDDTWHHLVLTRDQSSNTVEMFLDGVSLGAKNTYTSGGNDYPLNLQTIDATTSALGDNTFNHNYKHFRGVMDDVRVYNRVLSQTEIDQLVQGLGGGPPPPNPDSDGDGLLDEWEWNHLFTLYYSGTDDPDDDGIDNEAEETAGTNPNDPWVPPPPPVAAVDPVFDYGYEGTDPVVVTDEAGSHDGTLSGTVRETDPVRGGIAKTSSTQNGHVAVPDAAMDGLGDLTLSVWLKNTYSAHQQYLFCAGNQTSGTAMDFGVYRYIHTTEGDSLYVYNHNSSSNTRFSLDFATLLFDDQWHHLAVVRKPSADKLAVYVDGALHEEKTVQNLSALNVNGNRTAFGTRVLSTGPQSWVSYRGRSDDLRVYDRALDANEIADVYAGNPLGGVVDPLADTDGDGLPDAWEDEHGFDPDDADEDNDGVGDAEEDPDGDGFTNYVEYVAGTDPNDANSVPDTGADGFEVYTQFEE